MSISSSATGIPAEATRAAIPMPRPARPTSRRNPRLIIIGVLLVCIGALASAWLWTAGRSGTAVLVVARDITRGQVIEAEDLTTINLTNTSGLAVLPSSELHSIVGSMASRDMVRGTILDHDALISRWLSAGRAQVGLALADGSLPAGGLRVGDQVFVVGVEPTGNGGASDVREGIVATTPVANGNGSWLVDIELAEGDAAQIAALAAAGRIALVARGS